MSSVGQPAQVAAPPQIPIQLAAYPQMQPSMIQQHEAFGMYVTGVPPSGPYQPFQYGPPTQLYYTPPPASMVPTHNKSKNNSH